MLSDMCSTNHNEKSQQSFATLRFVKTTQFMCGKICVGNLSFMSCFAMLKQMHCIHGICVTLCVSTFKCNYPSCLPMSSPASEKRGNPYNQIKLYELVLWNLEMALAAWSLDLHFSAGPESSWCLELHTLCVCSLSACILAPCCREDCLVPFANSRLYNLWVSTNHVNSTQPPTTTTTTRGGGGEGGGCIEGADKAEMATMSLRNRE